MLLRKLDTEHNEHKYMNGYETIIFWRHFKQEFFNPSFFFCSLKMYSKENQTQPSASALEGKDLCDEQQHYYYSEFMV